jgi:hypothetical protein
LLLEKNVPLLANRIVIKQDGDGAWHKGVSAAGEGVEENPARLSFLCAS